MAAQFFDCRPPFDAGGMGWGERQEMIVIGFESGEIDFERGVGEQVTSATDAASAAEEMAQSGSEDLVAFVDDELGVAKQMSEADLVVFFRPAVWRAKAVRDPGVGTKGAEELFDRDLAASRMGQEIGVVAVMENPQPPASFADAQSSFVGTNRACRQEAGADRRTGGLEALARRLENIDERAFADFEAQEIAHQQGQAFKPDALGEPQIDDESAQVGAERRTALQALRPLRLEAPGAAGAQAAMQDHPRYVRLDLGDFDPVVGFARLLGALRNVEAAMGTGGGQNIPPPGGIGMERPMRARMGLAFGAVLRPDRRLPPLARRDARIVRRLGRPIQFGSKFSALRPKFGVLSPQRNDLRRQSLDRLKLHQNDSDQTFPIKRIKRGAVHPQFESVDDSPVKPPHPIGGEQLQVIFAIKSLITKETPK